jgi:hypothetical protein
VKPNIDDPFDSFDRAAIRSAQTIVILAADVEGLYRLGVELNDPVPPGPSIEQSRGGGDISDPTARFGISERRHQRTEQLKQARLSLTAALQHTRKALHAAARASAP